VTARPLVLTQMLQSRRRSTLWWSVGIAVTVLAVVASYPSVADSAEGLESYLDSLPQGFDELFAVGAGIATPAGYLNSQLYANLLPILVLVLGIGAASWSIAGAEGDGTLEMLLANPVSRRRVAAERILGVALLTGAVTLVATVVVAALGPAFDLGSLSEAGVWAAGLGVWVLGLTFASVSYGLGAALGSRGVALGGGAGTAAGTYVVYGLTAFVPSLEPLHWLSPWYWFLDADPLTGVDGASWLQAVLLPGAVAAAACMAGVARFTSRDLG
jgi:ABC-2 type transport system permease protein